MSSIVVVFPKKETAANIRNLLVRGGIDISGICTTGAQALQYADNFGEGIMICGYKMQDMLYSELRECLPESFEMLLIASPDKWSQDLVKGVIGLPTPVKGYDLLNTLQMMMQTMQRRRRKRREAARNRDCLLYTSAVSDKRGGFYKLPVGCYRNLIAGHFSIFFDSNIACSF